MTLDLQSHRLGYRTFRTSDYNIGYNSSYTDTYFFHFKYRYRNRGGGQLGAAASLTLNFRLSENCWNIFLPEFFFSKMQNLRIRATVLSKFGRQNWNF